MTGAYSLPPRTFDSLRQALRAFYLASLWRSRPGSITLVRLERTELAASYLYRRVRRGLTVRKP